MAKWSSLHNGKFPDPYEKLKFDPEPPKKKKKKKLRDRNTQQQQQQQQQVDANGNKVSGETKWFSMELNPMRLRLSLISSMNCPSAIFWDPPASLTATCTAPRPDV